MHKMQLIFGGFVCIDGVYAFPFEIPDSVLDCE